MVCRSGEIKTILHDCGWDSGHPDAVIGLGG